MTGAASPTPGGQAADWLRDLHNQPGVDGTCLQAGGRVVAHDLPFSDERAGDLAACIERLCESYIAVGRRVWQVFFGFERISVLVVTRDSLRLTILLRPDTDPAKLTSRATRLLLDLNIAPPTRTEPAAEAPVTAPGGMSRADFEKLLTGLVGRVIGYAQAAKIVQPPLQRAGTNGSMTKADARRIGLEILEAIPNRSKRAALVSEFLHSLDA